MEYDGGMGLFGLLVLIGLIWSGWSYFVFWLVFVEVLNIVVVVCEGWKSEVVQVDLNITEGLCQS